MRLEWFAVQIGYVVVFASKELFSSKLLLNYLNASGRQLSRKQEVAVGEDVSAKVAQVRSMLFASALVQGV